MDVAGRRGGCEERRDRIVDGAALFALKIALGLWLLHRGLSHVSDDDFARTVIAEQFAHAPRLDPSGTSWLPFPFWITGSAMAAFGRSLDVARAVALVMGGVGAVLVHAALRAAGVARGAALAGTVLAMATPWNAWLGAATVPEGFTGAFVAAAAIAAGAPSLASRPAAWSSMALVLVCASLSRYEVWPACFMVTMWSLATLVSIPARAPDERRTRAVFASPWLLSLLPMLGPMAWMAWNLHAHGSATHFLARVSAYRHAVGAAGAPLGEKLLVYPHALLAAPEILLAALAGFAAFALVAKVRARWTLPLLVALAVVLFLAYGETKEGAPTHHPERALVSIWWILAPFGVDGARELMTKVTRQSNLGTAATILVAAAALAWIGIRSNGLSLLPTRDTADESRSAQIAEGLALRAAKVTHVIVTPCAYEHFALIAAYGSPESVEIRSASREPLTAACPRIER